MKRYDGKKVVIIGGTSGMGLATAKMLLDGGARIVVTGRSRKGWNRRRRSLGIRPSWFRATREGRPLPRVRRDLHDRR